MPSRLQQAIALLFLHSKPYGEGMARCIAIDLTVGIQQACLECYHLPDCGIAIVMAASVKLAATLTGKAFHAPYSVGHRGMMPCQQR